MLLRLQNSVSAMTGMVREQERTANNLANAGTIGFKRDRAFQEVLSQHIDADGAPQSTRATRQYVDFGAGVMEKTGNRFDLAIEGEGFFVLSNEETGENRYTRAGRMNLDDEGLLRSPSGLVVEGEDGPIQIPLDAASVEIRADGFVEADGQNIGKIMLVTFEDLDKLERRSGVEFAAPDMEPVESDARLKQGFVEKSNADPLEAMTGMIKHLRLFEMQQRLLRSTDENLSQSIRQIGRF